MNAHTTQAIAAQPRLALDLLAPSKTNPRSRRGFDEASLKELAASIKSADVLQPILVRPAAVKPVTKATWPFPTPLTKEEGKASPFAQYEIVAGERRWRAARIAGLVDVPVIVRELTDLEVLRIQLIENVQRKDLDALEEAEGYEKLMQQQDAEGNPYTAELIGKLMGVSKATVYARLKLLALCQDARDAFFDGKIDASTALLIARIPVEKLQLQALKEVTEEVPYSTGIFAKGDKMSFRRAREILQEKFMLDLDRAPFDPQDAALLPKAGNCTACPKRTGNAPDLFDDVGNEDVCTDPVCFGMKKAAHVLRLQKQAEDQGAEVIKGKEAKKLIPNNWNDPESQLKEHGYATLDTPVPGDAKKRTLGQLLEENKLLFHGKVPADMSNVFVQKTVVANPHREGQMIETVNLEQAAKALREVGYEITLKGRTTTEQGTLNQDKQREKEKAQLAIENTFRARLFDTLHQQIEAETENAASPVFPKINAMLAARMFELLCESGTDDEKFVQIMRKYTELPQAENEEKIDWYSHVSEFEKTIHDLSPQQHSMLMIDLLMVDDLSTNWLSGKPTAMLAIAEVIGIDADTLKQEITAEAKAAAKTKAKAEKKPEPTAPATPPQAPKIRPAVTWPFPTPMYPAPAETPPTPTQAAQAPDPGTPGKTEAAPAKSKVPAKGKAKKEAAAAA